MSQNPRQAAFQLLQKFERPGSKRLKADSLLNDSVNQNAWSDGDRAFFTALVYGVLRQWHTLNAILSWQSKRPLKNIPPKVRTLLRIGLYQIQAMENIPDFAAVNTTVEEAKRAKLTPKTVGFINGVLRGFLRQENPMPVPSFESDIVQHIATTYSLPTWFVQRLLAQYEEPQVLEMARLINTPPPLSLRINTLKTTVAEYQQELTARQIRFHPADLPEVLVLEDFYGSPRYLPGYAEGAFYVQDPSSAQVAHWVDPVPDSKILDLCAAPGSKTTHLAALMRNQGEITAVEPVPERLQTLRENLDRLGVSNVHPVLGDATEFSPTTQFDRVLVDAPCSGLGTVRKHPEILIQMKEAELASYPPQQLRLLEKALDGVKPGSRLIYSTCSLDQQENRSVINQLLSNHPELTLEKDEQRLISQDSDGFYIARLEKKV